jgi:hypothetical protein
MVITLAQTGPPGLVGVALGSAAYWDVSAVARCHSRDPACWSCIVEHSAPTKADVQAARKAQRRRRNQLRAKRNLCPLEPIAVPRYFRMDIRASWTCVEPQFEVFSASVLSRKFLGGMVGGCEVRNLLLWSWLRTSG